MHPAKDSEGESDIVVPEAEYRVTEVNTKASQK